MAKPIYSGRAAPKKFVAELTAFAAVLRKYNLNLDDPIGAYLDFAEHFAGKRRAEMLHKNRDSLQAAWESL
jgi:hypothetical protein